jgi:hypothetical protein
MLIFTTSRMAGWRSDGKLNRFLPYLQQGPACQPHAVVQNKRLGHALAMIKMQQDIKHAPKVKDQ